ncbi:hypothetical protein SALBM311S_07403 [Streptomyces alboniger]
MCVADREVAGAEPAVAEGVGGLLGLVPVAGAELRVSRVDDFAGGAVGHVAAVLVDHARVHEEGGAAAGVHPALVLVGCEDGGEGPISLWPKQL